MENLKLKRFAPILVGLMLMGWFATTSFAATWDQTTDIDVKVLQGTIDIFAPNAIDFGSWVVQNNTWFLSVDIKNLTWNEVIWSTVSWAYFWVTDLKSSTGWYDVQLGSADLVLDSNSWVVIHTKDIFMILSWAWWNWSWAWAWQWWIFVLDSAPDEWWWLPPQVQSITTPGTGWIVFDDSPTILSRTWATTPSLWRVWMYWVQPKFDIYIPKYQQIWSYTSIFTLTLVEH